MLNEQIKKNCTFETGKTDILKLVAGRENKKIGILISILLTCLKQSQMEKSRRKKLF